MRLRAPNQGAAEPLDLKRRWLVITAATVAMQFSYWPVVLAAAIGNADDAAVVEGSPDVGGLLALGLALAPVPLLVLAFASRHRNPASAVLRAMGLFVVFLPLGLLHPVVGLVAAFGAAGVPALRREEVHPLRWRAGAVALATVYVLVLVLVSPTFAAVSGAVLPFAVLGIVDQVTEARTV